MRIVTKIYAVVAAMIFAVSGEASERLPFDFAREFGDAQAVETIRAAKTVRVWRLVKRERTKAEFEAVAARDGDHAAGWARNLALVFESEGAAVDLSVDQIGKLRTLLLSAASYHSTHWSDGRETHKMCPFSPITKLQFETESHRVELWVCLSCAEMMVTMDEKATTENVDFTPMRPALLGWTKTVLAGDPKIQGLR